MSKKSRKKQVRSQRESARPAATQVTVVNDAPVKTANSVSGGRGTQTEFNPDYSQTKKDLRRIGILAGTFITILVGLSFFLR